MNVKSKIKKSEKLFEQARALVKAAQEECNHPNLLGKYESNTGNWCVNDDEYWLNLKCPDCKKYWTVMSTEPDYAKYHKINPSERGECRVVKIDIGREDLKSIKSALGFSRIGAK